VKCASSFPWLAFWFLLFASGTVSVSIHGEALGTPQSTPSGPTPQESRQSAVSALISLSEEQVFSLTKRKTELKSLNDRIESLRQSWLEAEQKSMGLLETVSGLRKDLTATSNELSQSKTDFAAYKQASEARAKLDNDAVIQARNDRLLYTLIALAVGFGIDEIAHRVGWIK